MKLVSAVVVALAACGWTATAAAETFLVGPGGVPASLRDALQAARDGDTIDLLPGEYAGESAIVPARKLTIRGIGKTPVFNANGKIDDAKAIFVVRGGD